VLKLSAFFCGLIFGLGLLIAQMSNPAKVLNFLDIAGRWDPSLTLVMGGAVIIAFIGYRLVRRPQVPVSDPAFEPQPTAPIDARLIGGAALFGIGWGLVGLCPGPAIVALGFGRWEAALFAAAMAAGMVLYDRISHLILPTDSPAPDCTNPDGDPGRLASAPRPR
jgi:uncharacterized membrane protein YedE/YeeE